MRIPVLLAMILCDAVHEDPSNFKKTILGTFSATYAAVFPTMIPRICVYLAFADLSGSITLGLQVVDGSDETLFTEQLVIDSSDPLQLVETAPSLLNVPVDAPGPLWVQLFISGEAVQECRIDVRPLPEEI